MDQKTKSFCREVGNLPPEFTTDLVYHKLQMGCTFDPFTSIPFQFILPVNVEVWKDYVRGVYEERPGKRIVSNIYKKR